MRSLIALILLSILAPFSGVSQTPMVWHNPLDQGVEYVSNRAFTQSLSTEDAYRRIPASLCDGLPAPVVAQSVHSAGLTVDFYTNAPTLEIRYTTTSPQRAMRHMPATGVSGVDLYARTPHGEWLHATTGLKGFFSLGDTLTYRYVNLPSAMLHDKGLEYRLYLPLYNGVEWLEVGVPEGASFEWVEPRLEKPIVVYGTSIAQGACATRPGLAWTNLLQRSLDMPVINLGFSGSGRLDKPVLRLMEGIDASLYVLDCLPNLDTADSLEVEHRVVDAVRQLRGSSQAPILLVEHSGFDGMELDDDMREMVMRTNRASRRAYDELAAEGVSSLYYMDIDELGLNTDMRVDYVHPGDVGMQRQADAVECRVRRILAMPVGSNSAQVPVTQRREPNFYEWLSRHNDILRYVRSQQPRGVMIGNSITHYWGGEPSSPKKNAPELWHETLGAQGYANLGCGWDRVENVLWRVEHGELDGYEPERVVVLIGTNNLGLNTPEEVADGVDLLISVIAERQPKAEIVVLGLLPRRNNEGWIADVNSLLREKVEARGATWLNPGLHMVNSDGTVNLSLFKDGLHPNAEGYKIIVEELNK